MSKTVNTLNIGDKLYLPRLDEIEAIELVKIEKTENGIRVDPRFYFSLNDCDYNAAISRYVYFKKREKVLYVNIEDAQKEQRKIQISELKRLQTVAAVALKSLNQFTLKYFTDDPKNPETNG